MNITGIEWTNFSANPLKYRDAEGNVVWACIHASTGCLHCYSEQLAKRYGKGGPFNVATMKGLTPFLDEKSSGLAYLVMRMKGREHIAHVILEECVRSRLAALAVELL